MDYILLRNYMLFFWAMDLVKWFDQKDQDLSGIASQSALLANPPADEMHGAPIGLGKALRC